MRILGSEGEICLKMAIEFVWLEEGFHHGDQVKLLLKSGHRSVKGSLAASLPVSLPAFGLKG